MIWLKSDYVLFIRKLIETKLLYLESYFLVAHVLVLYKSRNWRMVVIECSLVKPQWSIVTLSCYSLIGWIVRISVFLKLYYNFVFWLNFSPMPYILDRLQKFSNHVLITSRFDTANKPKSSGTQFWKYRNGCNFYKFCAKQLYQSFIIL